MLPAMRASPTNISSGQVVRAMTSPPIRGARSEPAARALVSGDRLEGPRRYYNNWPHYEVGFTCVHNEAADNKTVFSNRSVILTACCGGRGRGLSTPYPEAVTPSPPGWIYYHPRGAMPPQRLSF